MALLSGPRRVVGLALLAVAIIAAATAVMLWELRKREIRHSMAETQSVARMLAANVDEAVKGVDIILRDTREKLQGADGGAELLASHEAQLELTERLISAPQIRSLFIVDRHGRLLNSSRGEVRPDLSLTDQPYFRAFTQPQPPESFFGGLARGRVSKRWKIYLARKFSDAAGDFAGVVVASMDASYFEHLFGLMQLDVERRLALYLEDGTLFAGHPAIGAGVGRAAPELLSPGRAPLAPGQVSVFPYADEDGDAYTYAVARTEHFPLLLGVGNNDAETLAVWRSYAGPIALGAVLVSATIVAAGLLMYRRQRLEEQLSEALNEASRRARGLIDTMMDAIVTIDEQQRVIVFNPAAERMFGWSAADVLGGPLNRLLPAEIQQVHALHVARFDEAGQDRRAMAPSRPVLGVRRDGTRFPAESTISRSVVDGRRQLTASLRDVTERERAKTRLEQANQQLRKLADALQEVRDAERMRIARELHDDLGQQLTGLKLDLSWLSDKLRKEGSGVSQDVEVTRANLDRAMAGVRRIWTELQPVALEDLGFADAVMSVLREAGRRSGIEISADLPARAMVGNGPVATALFRVVQEAVHNVVRHAGAHRIAVSLAAAGDSLVLSVADDGVGFDPAARIGKGLGLISMRERVLGLEGGFEINSTAGQGTCVRITLPLSVLARDEHDEELA